MPKVNFYNKIISIYMSNKNKSEIFIPTYKNKQTNPILFTRSLKPCHSRLRFLSSWKPLDHFTSQ